jgi:hypothetical protein
LVATVGRYLVRYTLVLVIAWIGALSEAAVTAGDQAQPEFR